MIDPYTAPGTPNPSIDEETDEIQAITPTLKARATTMLVLANGFVTAVAGIQFLAGVTFYEKIMMSIPIAQILLGVVLGVAGFWLNKMRKKGALLAIVVCGIIAVGNSVWFVFAVDRGLISFLQLAIIPLSVVAGVFALTMLGRCDRADRARERMRESGLETSF